eukprot:765231-Hanusia_phi.AAC.6
MMTLLCPSTPASSRPSFPTSCKQPVSLITDSSPPLLSPVGVATGLPSHVPLLLPGARRPLPPPHLVDPRLVLARLHRGCVLVLPPLASSVAPSLRSSTSFASSFDARAPHCASSRLFAPAPHPIAPSLASFAPSLSSSAHIAAHHLPLPAPLAVSFQPSALARVGRALALLRLLRIPLHVGGRPQFGGVRPARAGGRGVSLLAICLLCLVGGDSDRSWRASGAGGRHAGWRRGGRLARAVQLILRLRQGSKWNGRCSLNPYYIFVLFLPFAVPLLLPSRPPCYFLSLLSSLSQSFLSFQPCQLLAPPSLKPLAPRSRPPPSYPLCIGRVPVATRAAPIVSAVALTCVAAAGAASPRPHRQHAQPPRLLADLLRYQRQGRRGGQDAAEAEEVGGGEARRGGGIEEDEERGRRGMTRRESLWRTMWENRIRKEKEGEDEWWW